MTMLTDAHGHIVATTDGHPRRQTGLARFSQFLDYAFWLLYALLGLRLLMVFFHASAGAPFVRFIDSVTNPFYGPFRGIVASPEIDGGYTIAVPILVALLVYALLHLAVNKFLRMIVYRRVTV